jgi:hypothetical protein
MSESQIIWTSADGSFRLVALEASGEAQWQYARNNCSCCNCVTWHGTQDLPREYRDQFTQDVVDQGRKVAA